MTRWREKRNATDEEEEDELELGYSDSTTLDTNLLFPKETKDLLFPSLVTSSWSAPSRTSFFIMTLKRTLFACRGVLFFIVLFLIVSFIATVASNTSGSDSSSGSESVENFDNGGTGRNEDGDESNSSSGSAAEDDVPEPPKQYENITVLLPAPLRNVPGRGNATQVKVEFNVNCGYTKTSYALIGNSLRRALEFYERNVKDISVLDAALGTKIVTEQLKQARQRHPNLPAEIKNFVYDLSKKSQTLTLWITDTVKRVNTSPKVLKYTLPWIEIEGLWKLPQNGSWHHIGELKHFEPPPGHGFEDIYSIASRGETLDENESDACIYQVFHCDTRNITESCRVVFLDVERSMYSLTHQVIYMLLVQKNKCYEQPTWRRVPNLRDEGEPFLEQLCGKVWQEANSIAEAEFPPRFRDLFIEQIGMCSLAGYTEFLNRAWLRRIISWQSVSASGCFGERGRRRVPAYPNVATVLRDYQSQEQLYRDHYTQQQGYGQNYYENGHYRRKRSDLYLQDGDNRDKCSVHFTSVGITALSIHFRYLIDSCLDSY